MNGCRPATLQLSGDHLEFVATHEQTEFEVLLIIRIGGITYSYRRDNERILVFNILATIP
jgi:hypothetical protein